MEGISIEEIPKMIKKGQEDYRKEAISLYITCTGEKIELSESFPFVSDKVIKKVYSHMDKCSECGETLHWGSHREQKY